MILMSNDSGYALLILMILAAIFGPPLLFLVLGLATRRRNPDRAKVFFIISVVYLLVMGGTCGMMIMG